jgi:PIN domain nuclease of toxin-antitoxin system
MNKIILDASALLALINSEKGAEIVSSVLDNSLISAVNFCEVISELITKLNMPIEEAEQILVPLVGDIIDFDRDQSILAADLKHITAK